MFTFNPLDTGKLKKIIEPRHEISKNVVCATSKVSDQPAHKHSLIRAFAGRLSVKLLTKQHLEFLSLKRSLHRLIRIYTCKNAKLLEITCHGSYCLEEYVAVVALWPSLFISSKHIPKKDYENTFWKWLKRLVSILKEIKINNVSFAFC